MMFPSEMVILMSIALSEDAGKILISRSMDVMNEYIGNLHESLTKRGYMRRNGSKGYKLTSKGNETLRTFLNENRAKAEEMIEALQQLGIESNYRIGELGKEVFVAK
ncbi:hypothetical protein ACFLXU_02215 [Chloroflexota bacterium]